MLDRRVEILRYFKDEYVNTKEALSVGRIRKKFELSNKGFYKLFPNGVMELCEQANVPVPKDRYERVGKAMAAKRAESNRLVEENQEFLDLKQKESALKAQAEDIRKKAEIRNRIKQFAAALGQTPEGRGKIFSDLRLFQEFCETLLPSTLAQLKIFCNERGLSIEKILRSMKELCNLNYRFWGHDPLAEYITEIISEFIEDAKKEEKHDELQGIFNKSLAAAKCHHCGQSISKLFSLDGKQGERTIIIEKGLVSCWQCSSHHKLLCPTCQTQLEYKGDLNFHCSKCDVIFSMHGLDPGKKFSVKVPMHMTLRGT